MPFRHFRYLIVLLLVLGCHPAALVNAQSSDAPPTTPDTLLDGSTLNDIWLHINARDWEDLRATYREGTYYPVDFEWAGLRARNAGIRVRGNSTRNNHKPSLRIDFNRYVTDQEFVGLNALVLNSSWHDPSMLHDRLSMLLFRRMGIPAPRQAHVRLFVGPQREFAGVYAVSEEVSKTFLDANFREHDGHLYEYHRQDGDNYGFSDPGPELGWYIPRFGPKTHENESVASLYMPIRDLVQAVNDAPQSNLEDKLGDYFDVNTYITEIAVQNFMAQSDGLLGDVGMNNFFLYRFAGKRMSVLIPWDQDNAFNALDQTPWQNMSTNVLAAKIWDEPKYRSAYLKRLLEVADATGPPSGAPGVDGWLRQEASREYEQIRDAVSVDPLTPYSTEDFEQSVAIIDQFARGRADIVRQYVARVAPELLTAERLPSVQRLPVGVSKPALRPTAAR